MITTHRIEVEGGLHLEVATAGPLDAPPVLLVHGNGPSWQQFVPQFESFGDRYRLIAPSLRGHGSSEAPGAPTAEHFTIARLAVDVLAVLDHLQVEPTHLVGNSLGGLIGFEIAATVPERLTTLTTFGTTAQLRSSAALLWTVRATTRVLGTLGAGRLVAMSTPDREVGRTIAALMAEADPRAVALVAQNIANYDYTQVLRESTVPWLLLRGNLDRSINRTLGSTLAVIEAREHATVVEIDGAGHFANLEQPQDFDAALENFISRHVPSTG